MSEYQYYEFLALDRPLSIEDLDYVRTLSSRVQPTSTQAAFTYSYGNFRGDPLKVLAKHYDVMLYLANWGSKQLAFRFPRTAIDPELFKPFYYGVEEIEVTTVEQYVILNISFDEEAGGEWIEGEGLLASLAPLRDDILRGDLRALYLAWLASAARGSESDGEGEANYWDETEEDEVAGDLIEPPVPPGLAQLTAPLRAFIDFFEIDQDLVEAAATASPPLKATSEPIERWVPLLPEAERNQFLLRAARGEAVSAELLQRLREVGGGSKQVSTTISNRTFGAIVAAADDVQRQREMREQQAAEQARLAKLDALAKREEQVWAQIPGLLAKRTASGYDDAVAHLAELRDLAVHRKQPAAFDTRLNEAIAPFMTSAALVRRLHEKKLVD